MDNNCIIKANTRVDTLACFTITNKENLIQPNKDQGKIMFLTDFECEIPVGTYFKFLAKGDIHSCFTGIVGHKPAEIVEPKLNGLIKVSKGVQYCETDINKGCIGNVLIIDQDFILEKYSQITLKVGTKIYMYETGINMTLDEDTLVAIGK